MLTKAYAKINISLDIIGKRNDGYHLLKMIMQRIELYDLIDIQKVEKGITLKCNKKYVPQDNRNTAYKAAEIFLDTLNINGGAYINIRKNIPVAAGMAGGSADAAAVLNLLNKIYQTHLNNEELLSLGLKVGADVPFCINGGTALCEGIGEKITQLRPFKDHILVLVKPSFGLSTKQVYTLYDDEADLHHPDTDILLGAINNNDLDLVCKNLSNVLETVALKKHRVLFDIKKEMIRFGAEGSLMTGSGPTVYGLFDDMLMAQRCFENFKNKYTEVFITRTIV